MLEPRHDGATSCAACIFSASKIANHQMHQTKTAQRKNQRICRPRRNSERCGAVDQSASIDPQILTEQSRTLSQNDDVTHFLEFGGRMRQWERWAARTPEDISSSCLPLWVTLRPEPGVPGPRHGRDVAGCTKFESLRVLKLEWVQTLVFSAGPYM